MAKDGHYLEESLAKDRRHYFEESLAKDRRHYFEESLAKDGHYYIEESLAKDWHYYFHSPWRRTISAETPWLRTGRIPGPDMTPGRGEPPLPRLRKRAERLRTTTTCGRSSPATREMNKTDGPLGEMTGTVHAAEIALDTATGRLPDATAIGMKIINVATDTLNNVIVIDVDKGTAQAWRRSP